MKTIEPGVVLLFYLPAESKQITQWRTPMMKTGCYNPYQEGVVCGQILKLRSVNNTWKEVLSPQSREQTKKYSHAWRDR